MVLELHKQLHAMKVSVETANYAKLSSSWLLETGETLEFIGREKNQN